VDGPITSPGLVAAALVEAVAPPSNGGSAMRSRLLGAVLAVLLSARLASASDWLLEPYLTMPSPLPVERILPYQTWCGYPSTFWLSAEFQSVWMKDGKLPPLVTAGPPGSQAILGQPGTVLLYGEEDANYNPFLGGKFMGGVWADYDQRYGLEGGFTFASEKDDQFVAFTPGGPNAPVLARPVINALTSQPASSASLIPGFRAGTIDVLSSTKFLGAEGHFLLNWRCLDNGRIDAMVGFRYLELDDHLEIDEAGELQVPEADGVGLLINRAVLSDVFDARSRFYGGYVGVKGSFQYDAWTVDAMARVALGVTQEEFGATGVTGTLLTGFQGTFAPGGLLALPTNSGVFQNDVFGVVPEGSVRVGYQVLERLKVYAGVSALYWNKVIRVGDQIDLTINPTQLPTSGVPFQGPAQPAVLFRDTDFWLVAVSVGLEVRY